MTDIEKETWRTPVFYEDHTVSPSLSWGPQHGIRIPRSGKNGLFHFSTLGTCVKVLPSSWNATSFLSPSLHLSHPFKIYLKKSLPPFPTEGSFFPRWLWSLPALVPCLCFIYLLFFLKIYWLTEWLIAMLGLRFCARAFSSWGKRGPLFIAVCGPLTIAASLVAEHRLQTCKLSSCGSRAYLLRGMWDLPRPGLEPVSPELAGRFSTTAPPGKPHPCLCFDADDWPRVRVHWDCHFWDPAGQGR